MNNADKEFILGVCSIFTVIFVVWFFTSAIPSKAATTNNDTVLELLEDIRDNGDEIISKLDQIAENTRENNCGTYL